MLPAEFREETRKQETDFLSRFKEVGGAPLTDGSLTHGKINCCFSFLAAIEKSWMNGSQSNLNKMRLSIERGNKDPLSHIRSKGV